MAVKGGKKATANERGEKLTGVDGTDGDHGTVSLVDDTIDLLQVVGVRDHLGIREHVLQVAGFGQ